MFLKKKLLTKILCFIGIPTIILFGLAGYFALQPVKQTVSQLTADELTSKSQSASYQINNYLSKYENIVEQMALDSYLQNFMQNTSVYSNVKDIPEFQNVDHTLRNIASYDSENIVDFWVADTSTNQLIDQHSGVSDYTLSSRPWYQTLANKKGLVITDPYEDVSTKALTVSMIAPVYNADKSSITGAIGLDITLNQLYNTIKTYKLGSSGFYILASSDGQIIYDPDESLKNTKIADSKMSQNIIEAIQSKNEEFLSYTAQGTTNYGYISPIGDTGWTVTTGMPQKEYNGTCDLMLRTIDIIFAIIIGIMFVILVIVSNSIVKPLKKLKKAAGEIADGNLDVSIDVKAKDEVGQVAEAMSRTVERLKQYIEYINEVSATLDKISGGNLVYELHCDYVGEFAKIKTSLENIKSTLTNLFSQINTSADQVASGSEQVSSASQSLAQGATEQASSIEELSASINEVSEQVKQNAANATEANELSQAASSEIEHGNGLMTQLTEAMNDISTSSSQIGNIIKTIEDIAFQTNILALNAAVEAARAGTAGKGFSVVADEVRNLASKSADAAKETTDLIQKAIQSVDHGTKIADETALSLNSIVASADKTNNLIKEISKASSEQANAVHQITQGIDQISSVVQTNSATSEESAASSEELSAQAQSLKSLVQKFKIS